MLNTSLKEAVPGGRLYEMGTVGGLVVYSITGTTDGYGRIIKRHDSDENSLRLDLLRKS